MKFKLKSVFFGMIVGVTLILIGVYIGALITERNTDEKQINDSLLRMALHLEAIEYVRNNKTENAIRLLDSFNDIDLTFIMRYGNKQENDSEFLQRKKKVLSALKNDLASYPREVDAFSSDPEWQKYQADRKNYLERY